MNRIPPFDDLPAIMAYDKFDPSINDDDFSTDKFDKLLRRFGIKLSELRYEMQRMEARTGRKVKRIIIPQISFSLCSVPVVYGPVDKPTMELE